MKDAKRGAVFTKLAKAITVAVREGGGVADVQANFKLRLAVDKARQSNMPKENIERAIERATGGGGEELEEATYEGFLPGGAAVLVQTLSDNRLRAAQEVKMVLEKAGGTLGSSGAVAYMFEQKGELRVRKLAPAKRDLEQQQLELIEAGAEDIEDEGEEWAVGCAKEKTIEVKEALEGLGYEVPAAELVMKPNTKMKVKNKETQVRLEGILEKLEDLDDVQKVWTNYWPEGSGGEGSDA